MMDESTEPSALDVYLIQCHLLAARIPKRLAVEKVTSQFAMNERTFLVQLTWKH